MSDDKDVGFIIAVSIPFLMSTIGIVLGLINLIYKSHVKRNSLSKCTNCGHDVVKFYYRGNVLIYCKNCNLGYKPKELFVNANGDLYAEDITSPETKDIILDTKYYPKYIRPTKCHVCGSKLEYYNRFIGFTKCMSCGYYKKYKIYERDNNKI